MPFSSSTACSSCVPELIDDWDLRIFVSAAFEETLDRARTRDVALFGSATEVERRHRERYRPVPTVLLRHSPADRAR